MLFISPLPISHCEKERGAIKEDVVYSPTRFLLGLRSEEKLLIVNYMEGRAGRCYCSYVGVQGGNVICIDFTKLRVEIG